MIAPPLSGRLAPDNYSDESMDKPTVPRRRKINWLSVSTVLSATILIGAEVFGGAYAGSWAVAELFGFEGIGARILDGLFLAFGAYIMYRFVRAAQRAEPFVTKG